MNYHYLLITIVAEVIATCALKATDEFSRVLPSLVVIVGYGIAFYFFTLTLRTLPVGIAYALWAGLGIVCVSLISAIVYQQIPDPAAVLGIGLIVCGVVVIQLFSTSAGH